MCFLAIRAKYGGGAIMARASDEQRVFLEPEYYPVCLPACVTYNLVFRGGILRTDELLALVGGWHLNEAFSLLAEALHEYPEEQRGFFEEALGAVAGSRNYFPALREDMEKTILRVPALMVAARGQRLTRINLQGCEFTDSRYIEAASRWRRRGEIVCFLTYPALVYLPRVLDFYRDSEHPILLALLKEGLPDRYYHIIPANWGSKVSLSVIPLNEVEYMARGEALLGAGVSFAPVPES